MQSHLINKRRSEVAVAPLRPLALNRATSEILPSRGTLFFKVIKGTQLVQAPKPPPPRESKLGARWSAFLGDGRAGAGPTMHAVSVISWLTDAETEPQTPRGGDSPELKRSLSAERNAGSFSSSFGDGILSRAGSDSSLAAVAAEARAGAGAGAGAGASGEVKVEGVSRRGGVVRRIPTPDAARTSSKFIGDRDAEGGASWDEDFFFGGVSGEIAVRIVCIDKPLREGAEDEVVGELLIPVSRLPQNEPVEQWYGLQPPVGSGKTFTKAALLLRFLFTTSASPDTAAAAAAAAAAGAAVGAVTATATAGAGAAGAAKGRVGTGGAEAAVAGGPRQSLLAPMNLKGVQTGPGRIGAGAAGAAGAGAAVAAAAGEAPGEYRTAGQAGSGTSSLDEGFRQALLMAGVTPDDREKGGGGGGGGGGSRAESAAAAAAEAKGRGAGLGEQEFEVDHTIDPFGPDEIEDDGYIGGGGAGDGGGGVDAEETHGQKEELTLLRAQQQQLHLGSLGSSTGASLLPGSAAAEAALALSTDEILPAGLVDYFLVVGPAADEEGKLKAADYADCGFGSSRAAAVAGGGPGEEELPATAVEVESAVLEHFPEDQREDAPFPTKVEWFCFPQGLFLLSSASQPAPQLSSFVRFTSGVRSYGLCLTFYRRVGVSEETSPFVTDSATARVGRGEAAGSRRGSAADGPGRGDETTERSGGARRRQDSLWCPICLCVLTHIPVLEGLMHWLRMFHWCLVRLEKEESAGGEDEKLGVRRRQRQRQRRLTELDAAVFQLTLEVPLPVPGVCTMSVRAFGERFAACPEPEFSLPGVRELPALSFPLSLLLRSLRPKGVLQLFAAILQEGRILLHSTKPALLAAVAEGVFALMYPLQWPYAYVPVLPNCLIEHVESPQPFILGIHTNWLSDIAPDALEELIIVDCDLGCVDMAGMEQLPPRVGRSLAKAARAVLHTNLGNLDAPVRLSKPEVSASTPAAAAAAAKGKGGVSSLSSFPSSHELSGTSVTGGGGGVHDSGTTVGSLGLSAWTDRDRSSSRRDGGAGSGAGQGGGEKSAEAGGPSSWRDRQRSKAGDGRNGGGCGGGGEMVERKARRGRARGAEARKEALLRLEFARAMADMLYGFTECLFFLHPDRPIFNGARFLQEYCEESYVPFMSVVIDTLAFKYLLETQDSPPLRPFHDMLDKARRDASKKAGDARKNHGAPSPRGTEEPSSAGVFDGPFPVVNGADELIVSRSKSWDAAGSGGAGAEAAAAQAAQAPARAPGSGGLPPPAFAIPSPPLRSFVRHRRSSDDTCDDDDDGDDAEEEGVDFTASRGKDGDGIGGNGGGSGSRGEGSRDGSGSGGDGDGAGAEEAEQAAEEAREQEPLLPPPPATASLSGASSGNSSGAAGAGAGARRDSYGGLNVGRQAEANADRGAVKGRPAKREERSGVRLADARGRFIGGSLVKGAAFGHGRSRSSVEEEADEMSDDGEDKGDKDSSRQRRRWQGEGESVCSSRRGSTPQIPDDDCYDSAGDWASDGSDGLPAVLAAREKGAVYEHEAMTAGAAAARGYQPRKGSSLSVESASVEKESPPAMSTAAVARRASQSAGESALEEEHPGSSGLTVGEETAPPAASSLSLSSSFTPGGLDQREGRREDGAGGDDDPPPPPPGEMSPGRAAAMIAGASARKKFGGSVGASQGTSVRDRVAALSASSGSSGVKGGTAAFSASSGGGGSSVKDRVALFSASSKKVDVKRGSGGGGGGGSGDGGGVDGGVGVGGANPPGDRLPSPPSLRVGDEVDGDDDAASHVSSERSPREYSSVPSQGDMAKPTYAAVAAAGYKKFKEEGEETASASLSGSGGKAAAAARASEESARGPAALPVEWAATGAAPGAEAETATAVAAAHGEEATPSRSERSQRDGEGTPLPPLSSSLALAPGRRSSGGGGGSLSMGESARSLNGRRTSYDGSYYSEPVVAPLSRVDWSHEPLLGLGDCDLPQPREWTLADIGKEIEEDLGKALRAQTDGSANVGLGHGAYSLKAGAGLAMAAGAGGDEELDRDSEKLLQCLEAVYSSDRVSEEVVMSVEETLRTKPAVQKMFLQVLRHASQRGYASSRGPTLLHGPSFETLARFSYTLLCVCVDRVDYSVAHTLLQLTGNYFQVHEGGGAPGVGRGNAGGAVGEEGGPGYFSEFLSAGISRHPIFTDMRFWQHVLSEAVQAKTEKIAKGRHSLASAKRRGGVDARGGDSSLSSPASPEEEATASNPSGKNPEQKRIDADAEANRVLEFKDPELASEIVCRQVKVFLYEMASIGMRAKTAQRYVEAVSLQYKLQAAARNRLSETVRLVWGAVASMGAPGSPPFGSELTPGMSVARAGWSQAKMDAYADADIGSIPGSGTAAPSGAAAPVSASAHGAGHNSASTTRTSGGGAGSATATPTRSSPGAAAPFLGGRGMSTGGGTGSGSGRPNSASSAFSTTMPAGGAAATAAAAAAGGMSATSRLPALRLSAAELVNQLQAESSPSPRLPTTPASGSRGRFRSPGPTSHGSTFLSTTTHSPSSVGEARRGGSGRTTPSSLSPQRVRRSQTESPGTGPAAAGGAGGGDSGDSGDSPAGRGGRAVLAGTWAPGFKFDAFGGGGGRERSKGRDGGSGGAGTALPPGRPRRPLVGARTGKAPAEAAAAAAEGLEEAEEAPVSPGPSGAAAAAEGLARRFFFGGAGTMRSLAPSLSLSPPKPPEKRSAGAAGAGARAPGGERSTLPSSPQAGLRREGGAAAAPVRDLTKSVLNSSGGIGGEGNEWAEMTHGGKEGELPSLLSPVELYGRDGEGVTHHGPILCLVAFGSRACAGSTDGTLSVYDLSSASRVGVLSGHTGPVTTVSCGDDWVLSGSSDSTLRLWQSGGDSTSSTSPPRRGFISLGWQAPANAGAFKARVLAGHQGPVTAASAHRRRVEGVPWLAVSGGEDSQIRMWDLRTRRCKVIFTGHSKAVTCFTALREDGSNLVLSGAKDCTVRLWDINEASGCKALRKFSGHEGSVGSVLKIGPFAAVSCSNDRTLRTWDHRVKSAVGVLRGHTGPVTCVQQMPGNRSVLASGSADGTVMMWDVRATAKGPSHTLRGHTDRVTGLLASGGSVYSCSEDASMLEWEWKTAQLKTKFFGNRRKTVGAGAGTVAARGRSGASGNGNGGISCLAGTGGAVLTAGWDKTVRMWPRSSPAPQSEEAVAAAAAAAAASASAAAGGRRR